MEQLPVLLHDRAAPRRVDHDEIHVSPLEDVDGPPRQRLGLFALSFVDEERSAAALIAGHHHVIPVLAQDPGRRAVHVGEKEALDTAHEQPHPPSLFALGRHDLGQLFAPALVGDGGEQSLHLSQPTEQAKGP